MSRSPLVTGKPHLPPPKLWQRNAVFGVIGATIVLGWIGDAVWASIVDRQPLLLIALNAKPRYLILTVNDLPGWQYYPFALFRLMITKPLVWLVGAWYGPRAMEWAERRSVRGGKLIRLMERYFGRFGWIIIAITSNNVVCLMAGSAGFSLAWFMVLAIGGTLVRLWLIDLIGEAFTAPIDAIVDFVAANRAIIVAISIVVVLGGIWWQRRQGTSELDEFSALQASMDQDDGGGDG